MARTKKEIELHSSEKFDDNYLESYAATGVGFLEMLESLKELEENTDIIKIPLSSINVNIESGGALIASDVNSRYDFYNDVTLEAIASTIENGGQMNSIPGSQMVLQTRAIDKKKNSALLMSKQAVTSLILRLALDCPAVWQADLVEKKGYIDLAVNGARLKKNQSEAQISVSCQKIRTIVGPSYKWLSGATMLEGLFNYLNENFKGNEFKGGYYTHDRTFASFEVKDDGEILKAYEDAASELGRINHQNLRVRFVFSTSDIGDACASISVKLCRGNMEILIGSPIKVPHIGDVTTDNFINQLPQLLAKTKDLVAGLENLTKIEIKYPMNCAIDLAQKVGLLKANTLSALADFQKQVDKALAKDKNAKFYAHDVFYVLQEALMSMRTGKASSSTVEKCEENLARTLTEGYPWSEHDKPIQSDWLNK